MSNTTVDKEYEAYYKELQPSTISAQEPQTPRQKYCQFRDLVIKRPPPPQIEILYDHAPKKILNKAQMKQTQKVKYDEIKEFEQKLTGDINPNRNRYEANIPEAWINKFSILLSKRK